ncbi:MAG TPA: hypothetical protein VK939_13215, partial [Longimicrobiales bacterium]|nr:hypothetical protein [Longimicrobiales bacterium]
AVAGDAAARGAPAGTVPGGALDRALAGGGVGPGGVRGTAEDFERLLRDPALRDARGYIIPADQADFLTAAKFVDALLETGIAVHRATRSFSVSGREYPAGSFVVKSAQAFRPHVLDMFAPQDHPDDIPYPGGPPTPPYDNAGWTLAFQMGVEFDRILDGFDGPFERIEGLRAPRPAGRLDGSARAGWLLSHQVNDAFIAVNRLLRAGVEVYWLDEPVRGHPAGTFFVRNTGTAAAQVRALADELGLTFQGTGAVPAGEHRRLRPGRIALWDRYGGSMESGWTRWLLEQFDFGFDVVYPRQLDAGDLRARYDVILLVNGSIPAEGRPQRVAATPDTTTLPPELRAMLGSFSPERTVPPLRAFLQEGGTIIAIGSGTGLARHLDLPIESALVEAQDGEMRPLARAKYYVPGSVLEARLDTSHPLTHGMRERADFLFDNSPVFRLRPGAAEAGLRPIAWFDTAAPLRSGWAWGQHYLEGGVVAVAAEVGAGQLFLFGPEITFRAQPHGTFKLLFNALHLATGDRARLR